MNIQRARSVLGVWAPMAIGLFIIATSINFFFTAPLDEAQSTGDLESWRLVCSAGAFFVGGVLILSTYGRYTKTKEARREVSRPASTPPPVAAPNQDSDDDGKDHGDDP
jgi:hypothetical protein